MLSLTALPVGMAELQVSAGAGRVLLGSLWAADVLNLVVEGLKSGIDLCVMLTEIPSGLVCPHIPQGIGRLFCLTQTSEGRHVNTRTGGTRRTRGSRVSRRTLKENLKSKNTFYLTLAIVDFLYPCVFHSLLDYSSSVS